MNAETYNIVIVGGGTAGWLTAAILGAEFNSTASPIRITLIESANTPPIGVGEGTWPSMRSTLKKIGLSESEFIRACNVSLKQGTHFVDWVSGNNDQYYHPFSLPTGYADANLAENWLAGDFGDRPFAACVTPQFDVCEAGKAPKQLGVPEYAYVLNYGYHLDATSFADLLKRHTCTKFNVKHIVDDVLDVVTDATGNIACLKTATNGDLHGYLYVDCTGLRGRLIGEAMGVGIESLKPVLFNDRAVAVQAPYSEAESPIATTTRSTAQRAGWIWDIGLQHRRGIGYVHASDYCSSDEAHNALAGYLTTTQPDLDQQDLTFRDIHFEPGHRKVFWQNNCVAIGLSAGFLEPLEASALVLVELSARALADMFPANATQMAVVAKRFNTEFLDRWAEIIDFLKLHYVLSQRSDSDYWLDNRDPQSIPQSLQDKLSLWTTRAPWHIDDERRSSMFPSASYQYVLYGMGFKTATNPLGRTCADTGERMKALYDQQQRETQRFLQRLPDHRTLMHQVIDKGFSIV